MTFLEFIKSHISFENSFGDLARDIQYDSDFPVTKSEEEMISYLEYKTMERHTDDIFRKFLKNYNKVKQKNISNIDIEAKYTILRSETWEFYKENFTVTKVILVGSDDDIYRAYCIDSSIQAGLKFSLKSLNSDFNNLPLYDEDSIYIGDLTKAVSVSEAITLLTNCSYKISKPNAQIFAGLLEFLRKNE